MLSSKYGEDLIYINKMGRSVMDYVVLWERLLAESDKVYTCNWNYAGNVNNTHVNIRK